MAPKFATKENTLVAVIADEDTVTGFLLAGVGQVNLKRQKNFFVVNEKTTQQQIEDTFRQFTNREDISVVLISQFIAERIRHVVAAYTKAIPAVLEIPSKEHPYDPSKDSVMERVMMFFGGPA